LVAPLPLIDELVDARVIAMDIVDPAIDFLALAASMGIPGRVPNLIEADKSSVARELTLITSNSRMG
jgi:hypothetical protein